MRPLTAIGLCVACSAGLQPCSSAQVYPWRDISATEAVQRVRSFEGDQSFAVTIREVLVARPQDQQTTGTYVLTGGGITYEVCLFTLDKLGRYDDSFPRMLDAEKSAAFYGRPYDPVALAPLAMTEAAALASARAYLDTHCPAAVRLNRVQSDSRIALRLQPGDPEFVDLYTFTFSEVLAGGVEGPAWCKVSIDSILGRIVEYAEQCYPALVSTSAQVSPAEAAIVAAAAVNPPAGATWSLAKTWMPGPDPLGLEGLYHVIRLQWPVGDGLVTVCSALVDANTGQFMLSWMAHSPPKPGDTKGLAIPRRTRPPSAGAVRRDVLSCAIGGHEAVLAVPPRLVGREPAMYVGYVPCAGGGSALYRAPGRVLIRQGTRRAEFAAGSKRYTVDGRAHMLPSPVSIIAGRCYVPLSVFRELSGRGAQYDRAARRVLLDPAQHRRTGSAS